MKSGNAGTGIASAVDGIVLRSLKDHYLEASKMAPPPVSHSSYLFTIYPSKTQFLIKPFNHCILENESPSSI